MSSVLISTAWLFPEFQLILRVIFGLSLMIHGFPKLSKQARDSMKQWMNSIKMPAAAVDLVAINEFFGGLFLILGIITPIVSALITIQFLGIVYAKKFRMNGGYIVMRQEKPSYEIDVLYMLVALVLLFAGPGPFSVDRLIGLA